MAKPAKKHQVIGVTLHLDDVIALDNAALFAGRNRSQEIRCAIKAWLYPQGDVPHSFTASLLPKSEGETRTLGAALPPVVKKMTAVGKARRAD